MQSALFTNFTKEDFTGYWDGKGKTIKAGESMYMPDYLAQHFAKHLTNRELLRVDSKGKPAYVNGSKMTSPKRPEDVPLFMELFNKAYHPEGDDELGEDISELDQVIDAENKNKSKSKKAQEKEKEFPNLPE